MPTRYSISTATVVMLVLLRLNIGWHFFSEGAKHYTDPHWTSEPVLRSAKGPLAPLYKSYLPDFHGFDALLHVDLTQSEPHAVQGWIDEIQKDWDGFRQQFDAHYGLDDAQKKRAKQVFEQYRDDVRAWGADNKDALVTHVHEWRRQESTRETPTGSLPFQKKRFVEKQSQLSGEAGGWLGELRKLENEYKTAMRNVLSGEQQSLPSLANPRTEIDFVNDAMTYVILAIGLLLMVGLFTRLACVAGALFLLSVVMMQPFWVSETAPTFNQYVEMFALLTLATTAVGRWAGLDFFVHHLISSRNSSTKGKSDVSPS